jgi:hypothetical protein
MSVKWTEESLEGIRISSQGMGGISCEASMPRLHREHTLGRVWRMRVLHLIDNDNAIMLLHSRLKRRGISRLTDVICHIKPSILFRCEHGVIVEDLLELGAPLLGVGGAEVRVIGYDMVTSSRRG